MGKKSEWPKSATLWMQNVEAVGRLPKSIRLDGAGKNKKIKKTTQKR